jgi:hypothetical protein
MNVVDILNTICIPVFLRPQRLLILILFPSYNNNIEFYSVGSPGRVILKI